MVSCLLESITQTFWLILWVKQQLTSLLYLSHCKLSHSVINVTEQSSCVINCTRDKQQNHNTSNIVIGYTAWVTHLISVQSVVTFSVFDRQKQETGATATSQWDSDATPAPRSIRPLCVACLLMMQHMTSPWQPGERWPFTVILVSISGGYKEQDNNALVKVDCNSMSSLFTALRLCRAVLAWAKCPSVCPAICQTHELW